MGGEINMKIKPLKRDKKTIIKIALRNLDWWKSYKFPYQPMSEEEIRKSVGVAYE